MSTENEAESEKSLGKSEGDKSSDKAISRFAQYTAPAMLAMLASAGHNTPVVAQNRPVEGLSERWDAGCGLREFTRRPIPV